ncbi:MAG TPA: hypothetical protein PK095_24410 [Myxococcota bacterium]|nr:hypothetical protein [Myxococcota bacterium]
MKRLVLLLAFALFAPACLVHAEPVEVARVSVSVKERRCHPSRYWDGYRCVKKHRHYRHHHWHHRHHR